jgi:hypothetical protein
MDWAGWEYVGRTHGPSHLVDGCCDCCPSFLSGRLGRSVFVSVLACQHAHFLRGDGWAWRLSDEQHLQDVGLSTT